MILIDKKTFEIYGSTEDERISGPCFECDELLAPTISLLNQLGFKTAYCCSGHYFDVFLDDPDPNAIYPVWQDDNCYICFQRSFEDMAKDGFTVPDGYDCTYADAYFESSEYRTWEFLIRKEFNDIEDKFLQIIDNAKALYTWAKSLKPII